MFTPTQLVGLLDLTSLNDSDTDESVRALCTKAQTPLGDVAAVCVYPQFVATAKAMLPAHIAVATVVNFPTGDEAIETVLAQTQQALQDGANEIDVVLPYRAVQAGNVVVAKNLLNAVIETSHAHRALVKVILETGALSVDEIHLAAQIAIDAGADFLKTSTGKIAVGATPEAAQIMLDTIRASGKNVGIKLSGGVREAKQAQDYAVQIATVLGHDWVHAQHVRIGASALLDALVN